MASDYLYWQRKRRAHASYYDWYREVFQRAEEIPVELQKQLFPSETYGAERTAHSVYWHDNLSSTPEELPNDRPRGYVEDKTYGRPFPYSSTWVSVSFVKPDLSVDLPEGYRPKLPDFARGPVQHRDWSWFRNFLATPEELPSDRSRGYFELAAYQRPFPYSATWLPNELSVEELGEELPEGLRTRFQSRVFAPRLHWDWSWLRNFIATPEELPLDRPRGYVEDKVYVRPRAARTAYWLPNEIGVFGVLVVELPFGVRRGYMPVKTYGPRRAANEAYWHKNLLGVEKEIVPDLPRSSLGFGRW